MDATKRDLTCDQAAVARKRDPLRGAITIALTVRAVIEKQEAGKHFDTDITDTKVTFLARPT